MLEIPGTNFFFQQNIPREDKFQIFARVWWENYAIFLDCMLFAILILKKNVFVVSKILL